MKFYAGVNYYGTNISYSSIGWNALAFDTKKERDNWVADDYAHREKITRKIAYEIAGINKGHRAFIDDNYRLMADNW